jgi:ribonuclease R
MAGRDAGKRGAGKAANSGGGSRQGDARSGRAKLTGGAQVAGAMPTREDVLEFIRGASEAVGKREIARAFSIKGDNRAALKKLLTEMAEAGDLSGNRKSFQEKGRLPPVATFDITGRDKDGDTIGEPQTWNEEDGPKPKVVVRIQKKFNGDERWSLGAGDRILARTHRLEGDRYAYAIEPIKKLPREKTRALGIFRIDRAKGRGLIAGSIEPVDKKELRSWTIETGQTGDAADGDLVRFDLVRGRHGAPSAKVVEVLGNPTDQRKISLIAVHAHGIPDEFPQAVLDEVKRLPALERHARRDLTTLPLLTIDPADARDHDDAVYAAADTDAKNPGGWKVIVAIADVAAYVRPDTRLDKEARLRGNSVYFPDRVVPMLPERISNDLCSLREHEERPCLAVEMVFDATGRKRGHTFHRAIMRSAAKLSYQEAQAAIDGKPSQKAAAVLETALKPLWAAYAALCKARDARGPLDLDLPERKIVLDANGRVADVIVPERLAAHRLIEEMMIQANVAAAETLEEKRLKLIFRVHEPPSKEKLSSLGEFLETLELQLPKAGQLRPQHFNQVLAKAKALPSADLVNEVVLRSQSQAVYAPGNLGHFGLNLARYAHFTSPIRRYADLIVHRCLVRALGVGSDGITDRELGELAEIAESISQAERRAMAAERETTDRLIAAHLADRVGAQFRGRIAGVTRAGLFVKLADTGADGFIPVSTLGQDYFVHDPARHALIGDRTRRGFQLGDTVDVRLVEAVPSAGALRFEMLSDGQSGMAPASAAARKSAGPGGRRITPGGGRKGPKRR